MQKQLWTPRRGQLPVELWEQDKLVRIPDELWLPVANWRPEFAGYQVSTYGRVTKKNKEDEYLKWLLRTFPGSSRREIPYAFVDLRGLDDLGNRVRSITFISRLVASVFKPRTAEDIALGRNQVHHEDGNTYNNHVSNLSWLNTEEHRRADNLRRQRNHLSGSFPTTNPFTLKRLCSRNLCKMER